MNRRAKILVTQLIFTLLVVSYSWIKFTKVLYCPDSNADPRSYLDWPGHREAVILIPFRDRELHAAQFIQHFKKYLAERKRKKLPTAKHTIVFAEQVSDGYFNKGWVFDSGYSYIVRNTLFRDLTCVAMNDVDMLPRSDVDYSICDFPTLLCSEIECVEGGIPYHHQVGGCFSMSPDSWQTANGMSLAYHGWGGEDADQYWRLFNSGLLYPECPVQRPPPGKGRFKCLTEETERDRSDDVSGVNTRLKLMRAGSDIWQYDGINSVKYNVAFHKSFAVQVTERDALGVQQEEEAVVKSARSWSTHVMDSKEHEDALNFLASLDDHIHRPTSLSSSHDHPYGSFNVHWVGFVDSNSPTMNIPVYVKDTGLCGNRTEQSYLTRYPKSVGDFYELLGCSNDPPVEVWFVDMYTGRGYMPRSWSELIRWLRTNWQLPVIIIHAQSSQFHEQVVWMPRQYSGCAGNRRGKYRISLGNANCFNDKTVHEATFFGLDSKDRDIILKYTDVVLKDSITIYRPKEDYRHIIHSDLVEMCVGTQGRYQSARTELGTSECAGYKDNVYYDHMGSIFLYIETDTLQSSSDITTITADSTRHSATDPTHIHLRPSLGCLGYSKEVGGSRIMQKPNCNVDSFKHQLTFENQAPAKTNTLTQTMCSDNSGGLLRTSVSSCNSWETRIVGLKHEVLTKSPIESQDVVTICLTSKTDRVTIDPSCGPLTTERLYFSKALKIRSDEDTWCVDSERMYPIRSSSGINAGGCHHKVTSIKATDIPITLFTFHRDKYA